MKVKRLFDLDEIEEFGDELAAEKSAAVADSQISGIGISRNYEEEDAENAAYLEELLSSINSEAEKKMAEDLEKQELQRQEYAKAEEEAIARATSEYNRERYEKEQAEKAERERIAAEEEAKLEEIKRKKKESSVINKIAEGFIGIVKTVSDKAEDAKIKGQTPKAKPELSEGQDEEDSSNKGIFKEKIFDFGVSARTKKAEKEKRRREKAASDNKPEVLDSSAEMAEISEDVHIPKTSEPENIDQNINKIDEVPDAVKEEISVQDKEANDLQDDEKSVKGKEKSHFSLFGKREKTSPVSNGLEPDWKFIATHDEMTGLLNTRAYAENLKVMPKTLGVVFFDINNLKYTNDNFSHEAGNRLIKGVSESLKKHFGTEYLYRTGGDEFICLFPKTGHGLVDKIQDMMTAVHEDMKELTRNDKEKIVYAVSIGYAIGDGKHEVVDIVKAADASMYRNKRAYKESHPQYAARPEDLANVKKKEPEKPREYDEGLSDDQRNLKKRVKSKHSQALGVNTKTIVREIQKRMDEVIGILIASPTFDHLFIIGNPADFINLILNENALIDYSYFYVIYAGGPQYYGADEYYSEVTHLFENIATAMRSGRLHTPKDVQAIKGINIFKDVYIEY